MKKTISISILFLLLTSFTSIGVQASEAKLKALGVMAAYGTVGGALLGTASLAFDGEGRNVAKGASLGLYAGLLFGGYIVLSHSLRNYNWGGNDTYYPDSGSEYGDNGYDEEEGYDAEQHWRPAAMNEASVFRPRKDINSFTSKYKPKFYLNFLNIKF